METVPSNLDEEEVRDLIEELSGGQAFGADYLHSKSFIRTAEFCTEVLNLYRSVSETNYVPKAHDTFKWKVNEIYKNNLFKFEGLLEKPLDEKSRELRRQSRDRLIALYERKAGIIAAPIAQAA